VDGRSDLRRSESRRVTLASLDLSPRAGRGEMIFVLAARSASEVLPTTKQRSSFRPAPSNQRGRRSAEAERRIPTMPRLAGAAARQIGARSPSGASPRHSPKRPNASAQPRPRFARVRGCGRYLHRHSRLSQAPGAPVIMPGGTLPGPPGSGVTSPARGNRTPLRDQACLEITTLR
jgi:hypothetical protein